MPNPYFTVNGLDVSAAIGPVFADGNTWMERAKSQLTYVWRQMKGLFFGVIGTVVAVPAIIIVALGASAVIAVTGVLVVASNIALLMIRLLSLPVLTIGGLIGQLFSKTDELTAEVVRGVTPEVVPATS